MPPFKQAPHDQAKADMSLVGTFIPKRSEPDRSFECDDTECDLTARWEINADGRKMHVCDTHRKEYAITASTYQEKKL